MKARISFRFRIILLFGIITLLLVSLMARMSYYKIREIYLEQLSDQVNLMTRVIAENMDAKYVRFLDTREMNGAAENFYRRYFLGQRQQLHLENAFIFNNSFQIVISDTLSSDANAEPLLQINRKEIHDLKIKESAASLPFKAADGLWYMWGFYRLDENYWVGIREGADRLVVIEEISLAFWSIGILGIGLTGIGGWWLALAITKPIDSLVVFSDRLGKGEWKTPIPQHITGDLFILAQAMDKMRLGLANQQKEKEAMLAQVAHEIRNPLGGMELLTGLIKEDLAREGKSVDYVQRILDEIGRLKLLITAYLDYGKPSKTAPEWVDLGDFLTEIHDQFRTVFDQKNICFDHDLPAGRIFFDRNHLKQIFLNLVSNSVHFMPEGGTITVRVTRSAGAANIEIADSGPGIPDGNLNAVFEPFFTTNQNGFGLGLAVCKKLCEENDAHLSVGNNLTKGCTFRISLAGKKETAERNV